MFLAGSVCFATLLNSTGTDSLRSALTSGYSIRDDEMQDIKFWPSGNRTSQKVSDMLQLVGQLRQAEACRTLPDLFYFYAPAPLTRNVFDAFGWPAHVIE